MLFFFCLSYKSSFCLLFFLERRERLSLFIMWYVRTVRSQCVSAMQMLFGEQNCACMKHRQGTEAVYEDVKNNRW